MNFIKNIIKSQQRIHELEMKNLQLTADLKDFRNLYVRYKDLAKDWEDKCDRAMMMAEGFQKAAKEWERYYKMEVVKNGHLEDPNTIHLN